MKNNLFLTVILFAAMTLVISCKSNSTNKAEAPVEPAATPEVVTLFNGTDMSNWTLFLKDPSVDATTIFTVADNVINIKGDPYGYMRTNEAYSNYKLHVEYRFPTELSNSGIFVHAQLPDTIWPCCIENQLKAGQAGDFVCMNGAELNEHIDKTKKSITKLAESSELAVGEWNIVEITCKDDSIEVSVNGVLQNKGTGCSVTSGHICLQSEGKDIQFRNVYLTRL